MVFGLSETWLEGSVQDGELDFDGFRIYRRDRGKAGHGGVMIYIPNDIKSVKRQDLEDKEMEVLWIQVKTRKRWVLIGNVYRPPDAPCSSMDGQIGRNVGKSSIQENMTVVMIGDFNCNMMNPDHQAVKLSRVMSEYGFAQMVSGPTRVTEKTETQIDLLFTTSPDSVVHSGCRELGLSDHHMIYGILNEYVVRQTQCWRTVRAMGKCDVDKLVEDLISAPWTVMETLEDVDSQWEFWKKQFTQVIDSHNPEESSS